MNVLIPGTVHSIPSFYDYKITLTTTDEMEQYCQTEMLFRVVNSSTTTKHHFVCKRRNPPIPKSSRCRFSVFILKNAEGVLLVYEMGEHNHPMPSNGKKAAETEAKEAPEQEKEKSENLSVS